MSAAPDIKHAQYDFGTQTFRDASGRALTRDDFDRIADAATGRFARTAGLRTLRRAILLNTFSRAESGKQSAILEQALRQPRSLLGPELERTF
jgi:hypothetical protein